MGHIASNRDLGSTMRFTRSAHLRRPLLVLPYNKLTFAALRSLAVWAGHATPAVSICAGRAVNEGCTQIALDTHVCVALLQLLLYNRAELLAPRARDGCRAWRNLRQLSLRERYTWTAAFEDVDDALREHLLGVI